LLTPILSFPTPPILTQTFGLADPRTQRVLVKPIAIIKWKSIPLGIPIKNEVHNDNGFLCFRPEGEGASLDPALSTAPSFYFVFGYFFSLSPYKLFYSMWFDWISLERFVRRINYSEYCWKMLKRSPSGKWAIQLSKTIISDRLDSTKFVYQRWSREIS
jgi:hypothetical protein